MALLEIAIKLLMKPDKRARQMVITWTFVRNLGGAQWFSRASKSSFIIQGHSTCSIEDTVDRLWEMMVLSFSLARKVQVTFGWLFEGTKKCIKNKLLAWILCCTLGKARTHSWNDALPSNISDLIQSICFIRKFERRLLVTFQWPPTI